ncbi:MAG: hypothetical protein L6R42_005522 [Xanthoria sp. 1 TBL-2021]|nr:MAG: hypothetical protein L6R42_005522 [Xanthoria sp. 1 TBL-2021]
MNLSDEITVRVLKHLSKNELRQVRLVCKDLALLVAHLLVHHSPIAPSTIIGSETTQDLVGAIGSNSADAQKVSTPKPTFFSIPIEVRFQIYRHLKPRRIHIAPPSDVQEYRRTKPWALISVSRQFRTETWIDGLHEGLEVSLRHLVINEFIDISWIPDGPVAERDSERQERLEREDIIDKQNKARTIQELLEWPGELPEFDIITLTRDDWEIRWLQFQHGEANYTVGALEYKLGMIEDRRARSSTAKSGWGKDGVRDLAASFPSSSLDFGGEYDGEYDGEYEGEYEGEYDGGYDEEYEEDHGENYGEENKDYQVAEQEGAKNLEETPADRAPTPVQEAAVPQQPEQSTPATAFSQAPTGAPTLELNKIEPPRSASADRAE